MATKDTGKDQPRRAGRARKEEVPAPQGAPRSTRRKVPAKDDAAPAARSPSPSPSPTPTPTPTRRQPSRGQRKRTDVAAQTESVLAATQAEVDVSLPTPSEGGLPTEHATAPSMAAYETRPQERATLPASQEEAATIPAAPAPRVDEIEAPEEEDTHPARAERVRGAHSNALGTLIEQQFTAPGTPCRSYSDLERRSSISREALSRYVTARTDRRRSPTIDTLVAIADAMHLSLLAVCRAAGASVRGVQLPPPEVQEGREGVLSSLIAGLSDDQFSAVVELLRQMHPVRSSSS